MTTPTTSAETRESVYREFGRTADDEFSPVRIDDLADEILRLRAIETEHATIRAELDKMKGREVVAYLCVKDGKPAFALTNTSATILGMSVAEYWTSNGCIVTPLVAQEPT